MPNTGEAGEERIRVGGCSTLFRLQRDQLVRFTYAGDWRLAALSPSRRTHVHVTTRIGCCLCLRHVTSGGLRQQRAWRADGGDRLVTVGGVRVRRGSYYRPGITRPRTERQS